MILPEVELRSLSDGAPVAWVRAGERVRVEISVAGAPADAEVFADWVRRVGRAPVRGGLEVGCGAARCWIDLDLAPAELDGALVELGRALRTRPRPRPGREGAEAWPVGAPPWPAGRAVTIVAPQAPWASLPGLEAALRGYGEGPPLRPAPMLPGEAEGPGLGYRLADDVEGAWFGAVLAGRTGARLPYELRERRGLVYTVGAVGPWWTLDPRPEDQAEALRLVREALLRPVRAEEWARAAAWLRVDVLRRLDSPADLAWLVSQDLLSGRAPLQRARELLELDEPPAANPPARLLR